MDLTRGPCPEVITYVTHPACGEIHVRLREADEHDPAESSVEEILMMWLGASEILYLPDSSTGAGER